MIPRGSIRNCGSNTRCRINDDEFKTADLRCCVEDSVFKIYIRWRIQDAGLEMADQRSWVQNNDSKIAD